ncbi:MAG: hypothetical protein ACI4TB_04305 [Lachnospiraceae bacterium]
MKKNSWIDSIMTFFVCTACICILEGILGMIFMPEIQFGYDAFFSPPLFGLFSVLFGVVNYSKRELGVKEVLFRRVIHLLLIEGLVFGLNYMAGAIFPAFMAIALFFSIAVVFVMVYVVLYLYDRKSAELFNQELRKFQEQCQ